MDLTIVGSDTADCMASNALEKMVEELRKSFKEERHTNEYNTSGAVNIGMFCETYVVPALRKNKNAFAYVEGLEELANDALEDLEKEIEKSSDKHKNVWADENNRIAHNTRYKEFRKALKFYLKNVKN